MSGKPSNARAILRAAQRINAMTVERASDLTPRQIEIIIMLAEHPNLSQSQMLEHCSMDRSTMSSVMQALRRKKLVDRIVDKSDERAWSNFLTKTGQAQVDECRKVMAEIERRVDAVITETRGTVTAKLVAVADIGKAA